MIKLLCQVYAMPPFFTSVNLKNICFAPFFILIKSSYLKNMLLICPNFFRNVFLVVAFKMADKQAGIYVSAISVLKRAIELDAANRLDEAVVCYQEGLQLLISYLKGNFDSICVTVLLLISTLVSA